MEFKNILDDLVSSLPEIFDGFICNAEKGIIASSLGLIQSEQDCMDMFRKVEKLLAMASVHYQDINKFSFCYGNTAMIACPMPQGTWLFLTHSKEIASELVKVTVAATMHSLEAAKNGLPDSEVLSIPAETAAMNRPDSTVSDSITEAVDLTSLTEQGGELHDPLERIKKVLIKIMGPIGDIMLDDALVSWAQECKPGLDTLEKLYPILEVELGDDLQFQRFNKLLNLKG